MGWQELAVTVIVGFAVVSLYRHLRGMFSMPQSGADNSCHGCDDCAEGEGVNGAGSPTDVTPTVSRARR